MMAIYDTMQFVLPDVATLCVGQASATSAILLAAGAPGKRALLPHARVLLQQPHSEGSQGSISDLALEAAELARVRAGGRSELLDTLIVYEWRSLFGPFAEEPATVDPPRPSAGAGEMGR